MKPYHGHYLSYLLRIWKDSSDGEWRASLQEVTSGDYQTFANIASLYSFICSQTEINYSQRSIIIQGEPTALEER
jgi:hypothetical protein